MAPEMNDNGNDNADLSSVVSNEEDEEETPSIVKLKFYPSAAYSDDDSDDNDRVTNKTKAVKFADDEEKKQESLKDKGRSRQELLLKIARLTDLLKDAEMQLLTEKEKRKKKEKNLFKLAKELKKRNQKREAEMERMEELEEKKRYLEHHWVLAQKELDQEKALRAKAQKESISEYEQAIKNEKAKYAKTLEEHEARMAELKRAHQKQCDELCREVLQANMEADRLHNELNAKGLIVPRRALFQERIRTSSKNESLWQFITTLGLLCSSLYVWGSKTDLFSKSGLCSPVLPGIVLDNNTRNAVFQSPWWAPSAFKEQAFARVCVHGEDSTVPPASIEWTNEGKNSRITVHVGGKVKLKRNVFKAEILGKSVRLWKRNGHAEEESFLW